MNQKMLRALALASAVSGASLLTAGGAAAAQPKWECKEDLPPGRVFDVPRCGYSSYPLRGPDVRPGPQPGPGPGPGPDPGPTPYVS